MRQDATAKTGAPSAFPASFFPPAKPGFPAFGPTPPIGCLGCHLNATTAIGTTLTDHSFLFLEGAVGGVAGG